MKLIKKTVATFLGLGAAAAFASPAYLITYNNTPYQSNAFVAGKASPVPTQANSIGKVHWSLVRIACYGHIVNGRCPALIKMKTNTANPVDVGYVSMDIQTGDILPKQISGNNFTVTVEGPGLARITENS
ncbi:MAG: hypothetical protein LCH30_04170 [Proteobacteria bacterium]|nr:hypothetical protein [Pseudomonadota bacterium]